MSTKQDYYEILGIAKNADFDAIKKAYREAALRHHPDRAPEEKKKEAEEKFKEISEAYAVLSDPQKRALYDQYGHAGIDQKYTYEDIFKEADFRGVFQDLSSFGFGEGLFDQVFGDMGFDLFGRSRKRRTENYDLHVTIQISLEEAARGGEKTIDIPRYDLCSMCSGTGAKPGTQKETCSTCKGSGQVMSVQGNVRFIRSCMECHGEGTIIKSPCTQCQGAGRMSAIRHLKVKIPSGVDSGNRLRIRGEGEGKKGDLYLNVEIKSHPLFERRGDDLITKVNIPLSTAVLGGEVKVPLLLKSITMKIPAGTQSGTIFRIKGNGMPKMYTKKYGDQLVLVNVQIPTSLNQEQKRLMEEFSKASLHD